MSETKKEIIEKIYAVRDDVTNCFGSIFVLPEQVLHSYCIEMVNSVDSPYYISPNTYSLYCIGSVDKISGEIKETTKEYLFNLSEYKDEQRRQRIEDLRTLNFVPVGYEKMSDDDKKELIQHKKDLIDKLFEKSNKDETLQH